MMIVVASVAVALVAFIVYALDRRSKSEPIQWENAGKLSLFGGLITAGVVFATSSDTTAILEAAKTVSESVAPLSQDMFVGVPQF